jgi:hypothetical protein
LSLTKWEREAKLQKQWAMLTPDIPKNMPVENWITEVISLLQKCTILNMPEVSHDEAMFTILRAIRSVREDYTWAEIEQCGYEKETEDLLISDNVRNEKVIKILERYRIRRSQRQGEPKASESA